MTKAELQTKLLGRDDIISILDVQQEIENTPNIDRYSIYVLKKRGVYTAIKTVYTVFVKDDGLPTEEAYWSDGEITINDDPPQVLLDYLNGLGVMAEVLRYDDVNQYALCSVFVDNAGVLEKKVIYVYNDNGITHKEIKDGLV